MIGAVSRIVRKRRRLAVSATTCIVGPGWGRATRTTTLAEAAGAAVRGEAPENAPLSVNALASESEEVADGGVPQIGEEDPDELMANDLFDPATAGRVISLWITTPVIATVASYALFGLLPLVT